MRLIPKFYGGGSQIQRNILKSSNRNNIYFNQDFNGYNQWHSDNIIMPFYDELSKYKPLDLYNYDFENKFRDALDSFNGAGGFDYLYGDVNRRRGLHSPGTLTHLLKYFDDNILRIEDNIIGAANKYYTFPTNPNSGDYFTTNNGFTTRVGKSGLTSDDYFGIQTASRRPTIHISTNAETTQKWDNFFRNLGYVGAYEYLDHWIPTKDKNKVTRSFEPDTTQPTSSVEQPVSPNTPPSDTNSNELLMPQFILEGLDKLDDKLNNYKVPLGRSGAVEAEKYQKSPSQWTGFWDNLKGLVPNILEATRLAGSLIANQRIYDASRKGVRPNLKQPFLTGRQVFGDEASKQGYYTRAALINTKANQPITSDMSLQLALQYEANKLANELKALGDLIDNLRIKETSAEASLHADANILRRTEVANFNTEQFNAANAALLNLLAQKRAADWTSIDNALKGVEYRWRLKKAENDSILRQISLLDYENDIATDPYLLDLLKDYREALAKTAKTNLYGMTVYDYRDTNVRNAITALDSYKRQKQRDYLRSQLNGPVFAEKGTKITYKKKDDLLYKSAKDAVEHFRKMTKLIDDSYHKSRRHKFKFATKKLQQGGVAPFTVFTPVALGGETTTTVSGGGQAAASGNGRASKSDPTKDLMDMLKSLFSKLDGLPSDVGAAYVPIQMLLQQVEMEGSEMSTLEIATAYMLAMQQILKINYSKKLTDEARKNVTDNDALHEVAIAPDGSVFVQSRKDGKIKTMDFKEAALSDDFTVLSNDQLLLLREYVFPFMDNLLPSLNGAVGINKVMELVKKLAGNLGTDEIQQQGFSKKEADSIAKGLELLQNPKLAAVLLSNTPEGEYEYTETIKNQKLQMNSALNFIFMSLPSNMKNVLQVYADKSGVKPVDIVIQGLNSQISSTYKIDWNPVTGKAAKDANGNSKEGLAINSAVQLLLGMSSPREFTFNIGNGNSFTGVARISSINDTNETPFGADFSYSEIYKSSLRKNLDLDNASFGDVPINKALKDRIIVDNSIIAGVDLPYIIDNNGRIIPDFKMLNKIEEADLEVLRSGINPDLEPQKVNEIYAKYGLPIKYGADNQLAGNYKRFAVIQATAIEDVFLNKSGLASNGTLTLVSDENEIDKYLDQLKNITGKKDIDMNKPGLFTGDKDIYKGSIFIPIIGDLTDAISGSKTGKLTENDYDDYRNKWNTRNYTKAPQFVKQ